MTEPGLRERARGEVARPAETAPSMTALIERMKPELARVLPRHLNADKLARIALTTLRQTPALGRCTPESFLGALLTTAQLGLEPGPLGEAYLVPYGREATLIVGYRGLVKLAWQSGRLASLVVETVHAGDYFRAAFGTEPTIEHERPALGKPRGDAVGWYAAAVLKGGGKVAVVHDRADVERIRARSRAKDDGPWKTDYDAMAKKTAVRQLAKWLPMSAELQAALVADESVRTDVSRLDETPALAVRAEPEPVVDEVTGEIAPDDEPEYPQSWADR